MDEVKKIELRLNQVSCQYVYIQTSKNPACKVEKILDWI